MALVSCGEPHNGLVRTARLKEVVMTPLKGVTDDTFGRYFRKITALAARLGKSVDPNTVMWVLQRLHDGEEFLSGHYSDKPVLSLVDTFEMPALERFAAKKKFRRTTKRKPGLEWTGYYGSGEIIVHNSPYAELWEAAFLSGREGLIEKACDPGMLRVFDVNDHGPFSWNYRDYVFLAELGWHHSVGLGDIWHLLELHAAGKPNPLVTFKGEELMRRNIFYVTGRDKQLYHIDLCKHDDWNHWSMTTYIPSPGHYSSHRDRIISA